jgi:hypothetical protein
MNKNNNTAEEPFELYELAGKNKKQLKGLLI